MENTVFMQEEMRAHFVTHFRDPLIKARRNSSNHAPVFYGDVELSGLPFWHPILVNLRINDHISKWWAERERAREPLGINQKNVGAIVAALRLWQISEPEDWLYDIASRNGAIAPLDNQEITELAERILPEGPR